jgi:ectoine hydroxylase-related dioxygenase (phytanoyl-CoA dioxygenase family)
VSPDISASASATGAVSTSLANDGFAGPFHLGSAAQMALVALQLFKSVFARPGPMGDDPFVDRHLDSPLVAHLCTHPAIIAHVEPVLGADLVVWRSIFFAKGPNSMEVPWHQDGHFWDLDPPVTLTAWLAIDRAHSADQCLEVIPGSHKQALPHVPSSPGSQFPQMADPRAFDITRAIELPMDAGMFVLFDQRLVHHSRAGGQGRRLALSVRIAPAYVKIPPSLLPAGDRVLPTGWRSIAETPADASRPAPSPVRLPE